MKENGKLGVVAFCAYDGEIKDYLGANVWDVELDNVPGRTARSVSELRRETGGSREI